MAEEEKVKELGLDHDGLRVLLAVQQKARGSIGAFVKDVAQLSGLGDKTEGELARLEHLGLVTSRVCQMGTSGPFARVYEPALGVSVIVRMLDKN